MPSPTNGNGNGHGNGNGNGNAHGNGNGNGPNPGNGHGFGVAGGDDLGLSAALGNVVGMTGGGVGGVGIGGVLGDPFAASGPGTLGSKPSRVRAGFLTGIERLPPQHIEAEQGVIGSILLDNDVLHDIMPFLRPDDFYRDSHQIIFRVIRDLYDQGRGIDAITLSDELMRRQEFDRCGGDDALLEIINSVPHAANARFYGQIVRQKSIVRQLIHSANEIIEEGYTGSMTAEQVLEFAERSVFQIAEDRASSETVDLRQVVVEAMDRISLRAEEKQGLTGLGSGYFDLDQYTHGLQGSQLVILAARPSMGKTAFALNICEHIAINLGKPVLFVSLEMGKLELAERLLCSRSRVDGSKLRTGQSLGTREMADLGRGYAELQKAPIFIDESATRTVLQVSANCRRLKMRHGIGMVVIDYIQLVDPDSDGNRDSRQEQIAKISRRLKNLARELEIPVIALSQLNRAVEQREDRRPRMADLRESGAIEQDADLVLLLHRPEYYDPNDQPGIAEVIIAKNRNGATGSVKLTFLKNFMRFENLAVGSSPIVDAGTF